MSAFVRIVIFLGLFVAAAVAASEDCGPQRAAPGGDGASSREGVTVTKEVPSSKETIEQIRERESTGPPPPREDRAIPSHRIPRDNNSVQAPESAPDSSIR